MSGDLVTSGVMLLTLAINYALIFIVFPRKYSVFVSTAVPLLFIAVFFAFLSLTGNLSNMFGGWRGIVHFPVMFALVRGRFFQKLFWAFFVAMITSFLMIFLRNSCRIFRAVWERRFLWGGGWPDLCDIRALYCHDLFSWTPFFSKTIHRWASKRMDFICMRSHIFLCHYDACI